jgi:nitroimidazol reductase NimA-like FMN-containing flavoprotein (pyridoxamine 5'-phosphate oxidase superfamily)
MTRHDDVAAIARSVIGSGLYMVLGTGDEAGTPWVTPVYYAHEGYTTFHWVSSPEAKHSANLAARPEISIVIFDSGAPIYAGQAVYMSAVAEGLTGEGANAAIETFSRRSQVHGADAWTLADVRPPADLRLYRATASAQWILEPGAPSDRRVPVDL